MSNGLPPIQSALLPEDVRKAGPNAQRVYQTALAFESVLIQQLTESLGTTLAGGTGASDDDTADAASALTTQMIPDALTQSLTGSGGIGLARQLYEALGGGDDSAEPSATDRSRT